MKPPRRPFVRYLLGAVGLWAVLLTAWGIRVWLSPGEPELGRVGFFMIFAAIGSMLYFIATLGVYLIASIASDSMSPDSVRTPFSPPGGIAFHTAEGIEAGDLCILLRDVVAFLGTLRPLPRTLRRHDDWWQHDGLHFERGTITFGDLAAMVETPRALLEATPDDAAVYVGIAPEDARWYLRFRVERDADDEGILGRMALILPAESVRAFSAAIPGLSDRGLVRATAADYCAKIVRRD
jgi:hypothetical protein